LIADSLFIHSATSAQVTPGCNQKHHLKKEHSMSTKEPFFSQFVEAQELAEEETQQVSGGLIKRWPPLQTMKYPSDDDEGVFVTKKYPSDDDEGPIYVTMKFPSDDDEGYLK